MNLLFTICSLILLILLLIVYNFKIQTYSFKKTFFYYLVITCIIVFFIRILEIPIMYFIDNTLIHKIIIKITWIAIQFIVWMYYLYGVFYANNSKDTTIIQTIKLSFFSKLVSIINVIFIIAMALSPIGDISKTNYIFPRNYFNIFIIGMSLVELFIAIGIKMHWKEINKYKRNTLFISNILLAILLFSQYFIKEFSIFEFILTIMIYIFYFNIENPDLEIIKNKTNIKENLDSINKKINGVLHILPDELNKYINVLNDNIVKIYKEENKEIILKSINNSSYRISDIASNLDNLLFDSFYLNNINYKFNELLQRINNYVLNRIPNNKIKFNINIQNDIPSILNGDYNKLYYLITNLLDISLNNIVAGKIILNIKSEIKNNFVLLSFNISDTSDGIDEKLLNILNNAIGDINNINSIIEYNLYLLNNYIKLLNGSINASSIKFGGNKINVTVKQTIYDKSPSIINLNLTEVFDAQNKKIAIVSENNIDNRLLTSILNKYSLNIETIPNLKELVNKIKLENKYDIIFIDKNSIFDNDLKIVNIIKYLGMNTIPIIYISSNNIHKEIKKINEEGIKDIIYVPYEKSQIHNILLKYIN